MASQTPVAAEAQQPVRPRPDDHRSHRRILGISSLWFGMLAGPFAWTLHELLGYLVVTLGCNTPVFNFTALGLAGTNFVVLVVTLVLALVPLYAALISWRDWRAHDGGNVIDVDQVDDRRRFMVWGGITLSIVFGLAIVLAGLPALVLGAC